MTIQKEVRTYVDGPNYAKSPEASMRLLRKVDEYFRREAQRARFDGAQLEVVDAGEGTDHGHNPPPYGKASLQFGEEED
jgi:hypothetical protein